MQLFTRIAILIAVLSSCQHSPQKKYYLLTPELTEQKNSNSSSLTIASVIGIGPIEIQIIYIAYK
jgi:bacteriorhodopsin